MQGGRVIDADGHVEPSLFVDWTTYAREPYASMLIRVLRRKYDLVGDITALRRGMWEPNERLKDMDTEGIDVAVLFGGLVGLSTGIEFEGVRGPTPELEQPYNAEICRAYNTWLAEYCSASPDRLKGVAFLPWLDMEATVKELRRAVAELGFVAALVPVRLNNNNLDDPYFTPLFEEAEKLDVAVAVHSPGMVYEDRWQTHFRRHAFNFVASLMQGVMDVLCGGVLERYKTLRVAFLEGECGWLPFWMDRLDEHYEDLPHQAPRITQRPSHWLSSGRVYISCEPEEKSLPYVLSRLGDDIVVYASDYAHYDCAYPESVNILKRREDVPAEAKPKILGRNSARLYRLS